MQRKLFLRYLGAALGTAALTPVLTACGGGGDDLAAASAELATSSAAAEAATTTATSLSAEEIAALTFMREEEKLAHDVYAALYSLWGANVFYQIALSETTHTEAILAKNAKAQKLFIKVVRFLASLDPFFVTVSFPKAGRVRRVDECFRNRL